MEGNDGTLWRILAWVLFFVGGFCLGYFLIGPAIEKAIGL